MSETYDNKAINGKELAEQAMLGVAGEIKREGYVSAAAFNEVVARLVALEKAVAESNIGERTADSLDAQSLKVGGTDVKTKQTAKSNPSASSGSATTFVDTFSQDENGVITATRRPMKLYTGTGSNTDAPMTQKATSDALATKAPLASPTFIGTPAAPTAGASTDSTQLATTAFVHDAIENDLKKAADVSGMGNDDTHAYSGEAVSMAISSAVSGNVGGFLGNMTVAQMNAYTTPKMGDNAIVTDTGTITVGSEPCVISSAPSEVRWTTSGSWKISSAGYVRDTQIATTSTAGIVKTNSADGGVSLNASNQMVVNGWSGKQNNVSTDTDSSSFDDSTTIATGFGGDKVHLNIASRLWNYIQGKISSVLGLTINSYGGKAAAASVADLADRANSSNSADSVDWSNVTNKPATIYIGDYGTTTYSTWYSEWSAGKALFCRLSVTGGNVYYALDMIGRQNQDPITFVRAIGQGSGDFVVNGIVCNTDNSYTTIQSHIAGTTGTYTDMTVGASRVLYNTSGTKTVACSTDGFSVADTNGSKSVVIANGAVSASHGFTGNLVGNAATATNASVLIDNQDNTKTVAATSSVQTNQSDYIAVFVNNVIAKFAVSNFRAAYAERDGSGNAIASYYLPKENVVLSASGAIQYENRIGPTSGNQTLSGTGSSVSVTQNSKIMLDVTINNSGDTNAVLLMEVMSGSTSLASRIFFANVNQTVAIPYGVIYTGSSTATLTVRWSVQSGFFIGSFYTRWQVIKP